MKILVINCGSSSVKYRLFDVKDDANADEVAKGLIERLGTSEAVVHHSSGEHKSETIKPIKDYRTGIGEIAGFLRDHKIIDDDLVGIGHRVVHGGEAFRDSVVIDQEVMDQIDRCSALAPLHNPANLGGIKACAEIFPNVPQTAVFDTAFFHTLDPAAYLYALPYEWYEKHQVRRYGFHGTSHNYVAHKAASFLDKPLDQCNFVTMHLGNGCSMAAIKQGQAINTTMGLTPLEGLVMGTRCGDIDTAIVFHMLEAAGMSLKDVRASLEKKSGLLGISGHSGDMRDNWSAADNGNERARLALEIFARRVRKYLGAYLLEIGRCDAIIFTGGVGENAWRMRELITKDLGHIGIVMDEKKNSTMRPPACGMGLQKPESDIAILVIPTNEELAIARDTFRLVADLDAHPA